MSQPDSGEYSVRSLAEILREHGLETELGTRPGRRRRNPDDPDATGRSPRVEQDRRAHSRGPAQPPAVPPSSPAGTRDAAPAGGRSPGVPPQARPSAPVSTGQRDRGSRPAAGLTGPATPGHEPAASRGPAAAPAEPSVRRPPAERAVPADRPSTTGRRDGRSDVVPPAEQQGRRKGDSGPVTTAPGPTTSAIPALGTTRAGAAHPVTGPIPVHSGGQPSGAATEVEDDEPLTGRQSALAWVRFAGELVVALAVGIGLYFAFTVLWELMPYVALVAAPVSVTGLVAGVAAWRQRTGQGSLGVRLLAVLLLAGTVLVIAPAAGLLAG